MKEFFTERMMLSEHRIYDESIVKSPIVREAYLRHRFQEIDFESLMKVLEKQENISEQTKNVQVRDTATEPHNSDITIDFPIAISCIEDAKKIAESRIARNVTKTSREVKTAYLEMENPNQNRETEKEEI